MSRPEPRHTAMDFVDEVSHEDPRNRVDFYTDIIGHCEQMVAELTDEQALATCRSCNEPLDSEHACTNDSCNQFGYIQPEGYEND